MMHHIRYAQTTKPPSCKRGRGSVHEKRKVIDALQTHT